MSRSRAAKRIGIPLATLRAWERAGLMPGFGTVTSRRYEDRARMILAARRVLSTQRVREALAMGGC